MKEQGIKFKYLVGTMIEVPRGALTADEIAAEAQFFSFGTNDLTQMTFGFSRDDVGKFLRVYQDRKILDKDPFATFDAAGIGQLVAMAVQKGRATRPDLKLGICGEHGGDPASVHFFHNVGLDYVSARRTASRWRGWRRRRRRSGQGRRLGDSTAGLAARLAHAARVALRDAASPDAGPRPPSPDDPLLRASGRPHRRGRRRSTRRGCAEPRRSRSGPTSVEPTADDGQVLREVFGIHELAVDDALERDASIPKVETYGDVLYVVLHGINFQAERARLRHPRHRLLPRPRATWSRSTTASGAASPTSAGCASAATAILAEGPVALMHRIVDTMVDHYRPEVDELEEWLDELERQVIESRQRAS